MFYETHSLQLLEDAAMQILVHVAVLEGILRRLVGTGDARIEALEHTREPYANLEGIHRV